MTWKETCSMTERAKFVLAYESGDWTLSELCRIHGVSRPTGYKWIERYREGGLEALKDQSRAPLSHPNQVEEAMEAAVVEARRAHPTWGPKKLAEVLRDGKPDRALPSLSTMGDILSRHGLTVPRRPSRQATPTGGGPLKDCLESNAVWCADFKGWFPTGDGRRCDPLTITDGATRLILRCVAMGGPLNFDAVQPLFDAAFREYGMPLAIRTDNGPPFASTGLAGLSRLSVGWIELGVLPHRGRPAHPQDNGRHERMHRTLKAETLQPPAANLRAQQRVFDAFVHEFNHVRPHEALDQKTPASIYVPSVRPRPARPIVFEYPEDWPTRSVRGSGQIKWGGMDVRVTEALSGRRVALEPVQDGVWKVHFGPVLLGLFNERTMKIRPIKPEKKKEDPPKEGEAP